MTLRAKRRRRIEWNKWRRYLRWGEARCPQGFILLRYYRPGSHQPARYIGYSAPVTGWIAVAEPAAGVTSREVEWTGQYRIHARVAETPADQPHFFLSSDVHDLMCN